MVILVWVSLGCILVGAVIMSYAGSILLYALASLFAAGASISGKKWTRLIALISLIASLWLLIGIYPKFSAEMNRYLSSSAPAGPDPQGTTEPILT